jgi:hypothetical protein
MTLSQRIAKAQREAKRAERKAKAAEAEARIRRIPAQAVFMGR